MAREEIQKGHTVHLTASEQAGVKELNQLRFQGEIVTAIWCTLKSGPIIDLKPTPAKGRVLIFTLEDGGKIEMRMSAWHGLSPWEARQAWVVNKYGGNRKGYVRIGDARLWLREETLDGVPLTPSPVI